MHVTVLIVTGDLSLRPDAIAAHARHCPPVETGALTLTQRYRLSMKRRMRSSASSMRERGAA